MIYHTYVSLPDQRVTNRNACFGWILSLGVSRVDMVNHQHSLLKSCNFWEIYRILYLSPMFHAQIPSNPIKSPQSTIYFTGFIMLNPPLFSHGNGWRSLLQRPSCRTKAWTGSWAPCCTPRRSRRPWGKLNMWSIPSGKHTKSYWKWP